MAAHFIDIISPNLHVKANDLVKEINDVLYESDSG